MTTKTKKTRKKGNRFSAKPTTIGKPQAKYAKRFTIQPAGQVVTRKVSVQLELTDDEAKKLNEAVKVSGGTVRSVASQMVSHCLGQI